MRRIAFVGIENADSGVLESALQRNLGPDTEVKVFDRSAEPVAVAPFLVPKNKATGKLDGSESAVYIAEGTPDSLVKPLGRLTKASVEVHTGWSAFEPDADDEAIRQWLADGTWPAEEDDEMEALLADLLLADDDDEEDEVEGGEAPEPVAPVAVAPSPEPRFEATAPSAAPDVPRRERRDAPEELSPLDEALGEFEATSPQQAAAFRGGRFDSMSPNAAPAARKSFGAGMTAVMDHPLPDYLPDSDDEDLPLFAPAPTDSSPAAAGVLPAAPALDAEDEDLPLFGAHADAADDALPSFAPSADNAAAAAKTARELAPLDDEDDDLPPLPGSYQPDPTPRNDRAAERGNSHAPEPRPSFPAFEDAVAAADDDEDLPLFPGTPQTLAPAAATPGDAEDFPAFPGLAAAEDLSDGDEDGLPSFIPEALAGRPATNAAAPAEPRGRRAAEREDVASFGVPSAEDDGDDLPAFTPLASARTAPARRPADDGDGDELPSFTTRGEASPEVAPSAGDEDEDDELGFAFASKDKTPSYAAPPEKRPEWGMRLSPDEVRYARDNPQEVEREAADRRRAAEGYIQPVVESRPNDRELKPVPGAAQRSSGRVVAKAPAQPAEDDLDDEWVPEAPEDDFDPQATAPYMAELQSQDPALARQQSTMETLRRQYDTQAVSKVKGKTDACVFYVTGAHGGAGKTTSTWMMANTMAAAVKKDPNRPVFLIEGDYENSKLAQRLNLPPEKNSGRLAEVFRKLSTDRSLANSSKMNMAELQSKIIEQSIYVNDQGVNVIAAPYDLTRRDGRFLRLAIQKSVEYAERRGGYVFIDADTLSNDDILDRTLAKNATHVVMVSFGDQDHVDDTHRAIHTLTTPAAKEVGPNANGMGVPKDRIKLFFNKTGSERFEDLQQVMRPFLVEGHLPTVQGLNDGGWIGNLSGQDFTNAVTSYAVFLNRIHPMDELMPYQQRRPQKSTPRGGFMKVFGGKRR